MDDREVLLRQWLMTVLPDTSISDTTSARLSGTSIPAASTKDYLCSEIDEVAPRSFQLWPLCGDASLRRYFRCQQNGTAESASWIAVDTPLGASNYLGFTAIDRHWSKAGLPVPALIAEEADQGLMLLEDFGDQTLLEQVQRNRGQEEAFYLKAIEHLLTIQSLSAPVDYALPSYDKAMLMREMRLFDQWLLQDQLHISLSVQDQQLIEQTYELLAESAIAQPQVTVHRDYHSRNLMVTGPQSLGIIDFQDAVTGPISYDLVSLLKDCYVEWPEVQRKGWMNSYLMKAQHQGLLSPSQADAFPCWFDLMGAQRHLKAAGIFARLNIRDGKPGYLADIPRTLGYLLQLTDYPELLPFIDWLQERVVPAMQAANFGPEANRS